MDVFHRLRRDLFGDEVHHTDERGRCRYQTGTKQRARDGGNDVRASFREGFVDDEAIDEVRRYIGERYGEAMLPEKPNFYKSKKGAQDAQRRSGWSDITQITGWGINIFSYAVDHGQPPRWKTHASIPHGTRLRSATSPSVGHWALNVNDRIAAAGDFDGDGDDEIVIRSNWGMSILNFSGGQLRPQVTVGHGTPIGLVPVCSTFRRV